MQIKGRVQSKFAVVSDIVYEDIVFRNLTRYHDSHDDPAMAVRIEMLYGGGGVVVKPPAFLEDPAMGFKSTQEFFRAVMRQGMSQSHEVRDERLRAIKVAAGSDEAGTYSDPYGGFLVPGTFMPNRLSLQAEGDPTAGRTMGVPMSTPTVQIPARTDKTHTSSVSGGMKGRCGLPPGWTSSLDCGLGRTQGAAPPPLRYYPGSAPARGS